MPTTAMIPALPPFVPDRPSGGGGGRGGGRGRGGSGFWSGDVCGIPADWFTFVVVAAVVLVLIAVIWFHVRRARRAAPAGPPPRPRPAFEPDPPDDSHVRHVGAPAPRGIEDGGPAPVVIRVPRAPEGPPAGR